MRRPQVTLKTLLWLMACTACFFAGIRFDREWQSRRRRATAPIAKPIYGPSIKPPKPKSDPPDRFKLLASPLASSATQE